jgi:hypothetical protein
MQLECILVLTDLILADTADNALLQQRSDAGGPGELPPAPAPASISDRGIMVKNWFPLGNSNPLLIALAALDWKEAPKSLGPASECG